MNLYFIDRSFIRRSIAELSKTQRYKSMGVGDIAFFPLERRLIMVIFNRPFSSSAIVSDFPMVAQVLCDTEELYLDLKPVIFYDDNFSQSVQDQRSIYKLLELFHKQKLAYKLIKETLNLIHHKLFERDAELTMELLSIKTKIPGIKDIKSKALIGVNSHYESKNSIDTDEQIGDTHIKTTNLAESRSFEGQDSNNQQNTDSSGKLYIVEELFTERMKKEFYDRISLGHSEKETLLNLRRSHAKVFSSILRRLKEEGKDLYLRL